MSTFQPGIPLPNDRLSKSQQDLLGNNRQLDTSFGINHYAFSDASTNNGMHKVCQLVEQNPAPAQPVGGTDILYTFVTPQPLGELFFRRGGVSNPIQMTSGNILDATNGYTFLPGGLLLQWGQTASLTVNFPTPFSAPPYSIQLTPIAVQGSGARITLSLFSKSTTQFVYQLLTAGTVTVGAVVWMAIGPGSGV